MRWLDGSSALLVGMVLSGTTVSCGDDDGSTPQPPDAGAEQSSDTAVMSGSSSESATTESTSTSTMPQTSEDTSGSDTTMEPSSMDAGPGNVDAGGSESTGEPASTGGDGGAAAMDPQTPPTDAAAIKTWLATGYYLDWVCEDEPNEKTDGAAAIHVHGAKTRVCANVLLAASRLGASAEEFPAGVAAVKEVYDGEGELLTTVVSVKTAATSEGGDNWYWYENDTNQGFGFSGCTGCHSAAGADEDHPGAGDYVYFQVKDEAQLPPAGDVSEVQAWLAAGHYLDWKCEAEPTVKLEGAAAIHAHATNRICVNEKLENGELEGGEWPAGIAAVKELYGDGDAGTLVGQVLYTKVGAKSEQGNGFYWYAGEGAEGFGLSGCTGCHGAAGSDGDHPGAGDYVYERLGE